MNGFVINILKSNLGGAMRRKPSPILGCERSGQYKVDNRFKNVLTDVEVRGRVPKNVNVHFD